MKFIIFYRRIVCSRIQQRNAEKQKGSSDRRRFSESKLVNAPCQSPELYCYILYRYILCIIMYTFCFILQQRPFSEPFPSRDERPYTDDGREWTHARSHARKSLHRPPNDQWRRPWVSPRGRWPPTRTTTPAHGGCCAPPHRTAARKEYDGECKAAAAERSDLFSFLLFTHKKKNIVSTVHRAAYCVYRLPATKLLFLYYLYLLWRHFRLNSVQNIYVLCIIMVYKCSPRTLLRGVDNYTYSSFNILYDIDIAWYIYNIQFPVVHTKVKLPTQIYV